MSLLSKLLKKFIKPTSIPYQDRLWDWFGLSYASYLVIPRSMLCDMPVEWQNKLTDLLEELSDTFDRVPIKGTYFVYIRDEKGKFMEDPLKHYRHPDYALLDSIRLKPRDKGF